MNRLCRRCQCIDRPAEHSRQQCRRRFIDLDNMLKSYEHITKNKNRDNRYRHDSNFKFQSPNSKSRPQRIAFERIDYAIKTQIPNGRTGYP
jgi:hypothetical protein